MPPQRTRLASFLAKANTAGPLPRHRRKLGRCWLWAGSINNAGYGRLGPGYAHRFAWEHFRGPIPDGLSVLHHCDRRHCVNPDHLFIGTAKDNGLDMAAKGRARKGAEAYPRQTGEVRRGRRRLWATAGERNGSARLTDDQAMQIKVWLAESDRTMAEIARMFEVSPHIIRNIAYGKTWRHIT